MTSVYAYGTAHAVVMVGSFGSEGLKPRQIGPAHATIGRVNGQSRKALCGAYVTIDEQLPWPPEGYENQQLCENCATLAAEHPMLARRIRDETGQVRRFVNVYVDGDDVRYGDRESTAVRDGAVVQVLPSIAGG